MPMAALALRRFIVIGQWLAERVENWAHDERIAVLPVKWFPKKKFGYWLLAKAYIRNGKPDRAADLLLRAPADVRSATSIVVRLEKAFRDQDDHVRAHAVLSRAHIDHPTDPEILVRLSTLHKDAAQLERAHELLLAAEALGRDEAIRRLFIEIAAKKMAA